MTKSKNFVVHTGIAVEYGVCTENFLIFDSLKKAQEYVDNYVKMWNIGRVEDFLEKQENKFYRSIYLSEYCFIAISEQET